MRDSSHSMGLMSHAALAQGMATREGFDEALREHELPPPDADLPTALTSDVLIPSTIAEAESSEHAEIHGVVPEHESSTAYCRPTRSAPHSSQYVVSLTRNAVQLEVR